MCRERASRVICRTYRGPKGRQGNKKLCQDATVSIARTTYVVDVTLARGRDLRLHSEAHHAAYSHAIQQPLVSSWRGEQHGKHKQHAHYLCPGQVCEAFSDYVSLLTCRRAILQMKNQRDKLQQYQKRITVLTNREKEIAKECLAKGDTKRAKLALRRKKYQESLLAKTDAQLQQLEQLTSDVEFALVQKDVLYGLQQGTAVLKEIHKEMGGIEQVEKLLEENEEARAYQEVGSHAIWSLLRFLLITSRIRKSRSSSQARCRTRTKTRWKTSSRRWKPRSAVSRCPRRPSSSPS